MSRYGQLAAIASDPTASADNREASLGDLFLEFQALGRER